MMSEDKMLDTYKWVLRKWKFTVDIGFAIQEVDCFRKWGLTVYDSYYSFAVNVIASAIKGVLINEFTALMSIYDRQAIRRAVALLFYDKEIRNYLESRGIIFVGEFADLYAAEVEYAQYRLNETVLDGLLSVLLRVDFAGHTIASFESVRRFIDGEDTDKLLTLVTGDVYSLCLVRDCDSGGFKITDDIILAMCNKESNTAWVITSYLTILDVLKGAKSA